MSSTGWTNRSTGTRAVSPGFEKVETWEAPGLVAMVIAPLGFAAESAIYLNGFEWLSPLERAARLTIIGAALAAVTVMVGRKLTGPVPRPGSPTA